MTISLSDNDPRISYSVSQGVTQTTFTVPFEFFDLDDLNVYVDGTQKTKTTHYTLASGGSGSTGSITMSVTGATGGSTVVITRDIDHERTTDFQTSGPFNIASLNTELDRFTAIAADLQDGIDRSLRLTDFDAAASLVLPDVNTRKGKTLAFNASSGAVESGPSISDVQTVSAAAADIATLADIEDGTDATNAIQTVAGISSNVSTVAGISGNVTTVAGISSNVTSVAADASDIGTVASNISSVNTNASNITAIQGAAANATTATTKASEAAASQTAAASSASSASTSAATSTTKAAEAATSASNASTSETNSAASATAAASSATAAAASQTAAAASASSAASSFDSFDDRYLGPKSSNPSQDNDGNALVSGALYFNSTANEMRVYDGANWIAATSAGNVSLILYEYTATSNQTTFSGSDDNSATLSYTVDNLQVVMNGIVLDPSDFTATNGTSVVLATGAAAGSLINIYAFKSFTTADMVSASAGGTFAGNVNITARLDVDNIRIDSNTISTTSGDMTLDAVGDVIIDADGADIRLKHAGTEWGRFVDSTNNFLILNPIADKDIIFNGIDGSSEISALTLDMSDAGKAVFNGGATFGGNVGIGTTSPNSHLTTQTSSTSTSAFDFGVQVNNSFASNDSISAIGFHNRADVNGTGVGGAIAYVGGGASGGSGNITFNIKDNSDISNVVDVADEKMRINSSGNVGINETSPSTFLHIDNGGANGSGQADAVRLHNPGTTAGDGAGIKFTSGTSTTGASIFGIGQAANSASLVFRAGGDTERMRINNNGTIISQNVGSTSANLEINGASTNGHYNILMNGDSGNGYKIAFKHGSSVVGSIITTSSNTSYNTSSDARLKENIADMTGAIARVKQLSPKRFSWIVDELDAANVDGFLAHEAQAIVPEAVTGNKDAVDDDDNPIYQQIDQSKLIPLLTGALREAITKIETLETKVAALEAGE